PSHRASRCSGATPTGAAARSRGPRTGPRWCTGAADRHHRRVLFLVVSVLIGGLVIGGLGRLVVRGPTPLGCLGTIGVGVLGSVIGGAIARAIYRYPDNHPV